MISVIAFLLVSGCVCAPSGNTTSSTSSSSSSSTSSSSSSNNGQSISSSVSSSSNGGNGLVYSVTQQFSSSSVVPNITTSLGNVTVSQTTLPLLGSSIFKVDRTAESIRNQTKQAFAAIQKQNQAHFSVMNKMAGSINQAVKASHDAFRKSMKTMFQPISFFASSPFFV